VRVAGQPPPLLLLGGDQLAEQVAALALHPLQVGDVHGHRDHAGDPPVGVEQRPVVDVEDDVADRSLGPQLLAGQQPLEVGGRLRLVAAQLHERAPDPLRGGDAEPLEGPALGEAADAVGVVGRQDDREVLDLAEEALGAAVGAVQQGRRDEQVQAGPVGPPAAALDLEAGLGALGGRGPAQVGQDGVVARLGQVGDGAVQQLGLGAAQELAEGAVTRRKRPSRPTSAIPDGGLVEAEAEVRPCAPLTRRRAGPRLGQSRPHRERRMSG
jgi:hypothetical protein